MRHILARDSIATLEGFARANVVLAFDFDGTLAPIVRRPAAAAMRRRTVSLLTALVDRYPCAVISGRSRADATRRLHGVSPALVVGNHGIEPWHASSRLRREVRGWRDLLAKRLACVDGISIENKDFSLAVHYRCAVDKQEARSAIREAVALLADVRLVGGKQVVNVLPAGAPHKGMALERVQSELGCDSGIYVGDDDTDEDVFALPQTGQLLGIRVGRKKSSAAPFFIRSQSEIDALLATLLAFRRRGSR